MKAKLNQPPPAAVSVLRQAALAGPGHHGNRRASTPSERAELRDRLEVLGVDPPLFLDKEQTWIDRRAKLFEAGDYPDKGLKISQADLARLVHTFDLPVPVLIEHAKNPLELGYLTDVRHEGDELFGTISLTKEASDLVDASGAHSLSLGLDAGLSHIQEVSLVKNPRVASARMFTGQVLHEDIDWRNEYLRLKATEEARAASSRLDELVATGKLLPAQLPFAQALVSQTDSVQFDGESRSVASLTLSLLELSATSPLLREHAPAGSTASGLAADERAFYDRYFAGLSIADIARHRQSQTQPLHP